MGVAGQRGAGIRPSLGCAAQARTALVDVRSFPVSVKGVAVQRGRVLLLKNERDEWELPGGKLELGEEPPACVMRELREETGWEVSVGPILDCWQYHVGDGRVVVIVTYGCHVTSNGPPVVSSEHSQATLFSPAEIPALTMPDGYKRSVQTWCGLLAGTSEGRGTG
ncbi:MAG: NUDIX domain-containing protein [Actinobacteria bacterium]|nr:NUDIX domain-containing protein [Actinomycetota bacterium]